MKPRVSRAAECLFVHDTTGAFPDLWRGLRDAGYAVCDVDGPDGAAVAASEHAPALVLVAAAAGVPAAADACRALRAQVALACAAFAVVGRAPLPADAGDALRGSVEYLDGSRNTLALVAAVSRLLEHRRMAAAGRRQLAVATSIASSLAEGVLATDASGVVTFVNPAAEAMLGARPGELVGQPLGGALQLEGCGEDEARCPVVLALTEGRVTSVEQGLVGSPSRRMFPAAYTVSPVRVGDAITGAVLAFHDVTKAAEAEARLRAGQQALREAQRLAQLGFWTWSPHDDVVTWSEELYRIAGVDPGQPAPGVEEQRRRFYGTHGERLVELLERTARTGEPFETELEFVRPDGTRRWGIVRGEALRESDRTVGVHGTVQDVTEARRQHRLLQLNEQRLKRQRAMLESANHRLEQTERRYRDLVENLNDMVFSLDVRGRFQYVSPAAARYGYAPADLIGRHFSDVVHPDDLPQVTARLDQLAAGLPQSHEFRAIGRDGSTHEIRVSSRAAYENGIYAGVTGVLFDVTHERRAEEHLRQAQRLEAVGRLAGGVAHDFNNLLVAINGYAEFAIDAVREGDPLRSDLEEILKAGNRAAALTRQLLALSRKQVMNPKVISLSDVVRNMEGMLRRLIGEDIEFSTRLAHPLAPVLADPGQIEQVIMNLIVNARDAMPTGGRLVIETRNVPGALPDSPARVALLVSDSGCGMDEETRERIFEPFFTTKGAGEGTGLGLAMVHGIVTQSGGTIDVETAPAQGTTFEIAFPVTEAAEQAAGAALAQVPRRGTETILLVEDEPSVRALAKRFLTGAGYRVLVAATGGDALLTSETFDGRIDLLLTDVVMPQMSGRELAERLVARRTGLRVLFMSGYTGTVIAHHGLSALGYPLVEKPFNKFDLTRAVRAALDAGSTEEAAADGARSRRL